MTSPSLSVDFSDIERAIDALERQGFERRAGVHTSKALRTAGSVVQKKARAEAAPHRRTGRMRGQIRSRNHGRGMDTVVRVTTGGRAANLVIAGVSPHVIAPGKLMPIHMGTGAFRGGKGTGITGFATRVQHPGFPGDPFFGRAIDKSEPDIKRLVDAAAEAMVQELAAKMRGRSR